MISIVVPNYNGYDLLKKNIPLVVKACETYHRLTSERCQFVVVDDCSVDDSADLLLRFQEDLEGEKYLDFHVVLREKNGGFSAAMNSGIAASQGRYILSLNSDVAVTENFLQPLVDGFSEGVFSTKATSILPDGTNESIKSARWRKGLLEPYVASPEEYDPKMGVLYPDAGCCMYDAEKLKKLGGFDEMYCPFYFEDFDLGLRALARGWKHVYISESQVEHAHNQTVKKVVKRLDQNPVFIRNRELFNMKNITDPRVVIPREFWKVFRFGKALVTRNRPMIQGIWESYLIVLGVHRLTMKPNEKNLSKREIDEFLYKK
jgi:GT2 family glycosyltransferase